MSAKTKQLELDSLSATIAQDNPCPELAAQATQLVMGSGNPDADIVLIGEAPGKKEDEQEIRQYVIDAQLKFGDSFV